MASFRKRGSTWQFRIIYTDQATGKVRERSKGGFKTKKEAQLAAAEEERKLDLGINTKKEEMFLKDYLDEWYENFKKDTVTWGTERNILNAINLCVENMGYTRLNQLDQVQFQKFINKVAPNYSKSTLQRYVSTLSEAFDQAIQLDYMRKNPAYKVKYPRTVKSVRKEKKNIELEEYMQLIQAAEKEWSAEYPQYLYITYALVGTGARIGEICALSVDDVDLKQKVVHINKTLVSESGVWKVKETTKTGESGERTIGLDDFTVEKLKKYKKIRNELAFRNGSKTNFFFINEISELVKTVNYGSALKTICRRNGLRHFTPHMFRHTHETIMWESGVTDLNFIGARLGDKDKSILLNTYGHMSTHSEMMNMDKINEFMARWSKYGQIASDS